MHCLSLHVSFSLQVLLLSDHQYDMEAGLEAESEGLGAEPGSVRASSSMTTQLQALRKALYHKYLQEVAALKDEHSAELRRLREEREEEEEVGVGVGERERGGGGGTAAGGGNSLEEKIYWERVEEEVAKVGASAWLHLRDF